MLLMHTRAVSMPAHWTARKVGAGVTAIAALFCASSQVFSATPSVQATVSKALPIKEGKDIASPASRSDLVIQPLCQEPVGTPQSVELMAGKSIYLRLNQAASRLTLGQDQEGVVHARLVSETDLYLVGGKVGSTNMTVHEKKSGRCSVFEIIVRLDAAPLQATLGSVLPNEKNIVVRTVGDTLVLTGEVSNAVAAQQVEAIAKSYAVRNAKNLEAAGGEKSGGGGGGGGRIDPASLVVNMLTVAAPQQVMLEVKVAEISKTVLDQFGINFSRAYSLADGSAIRYLNGLLGGKAGLAGQVSGIVSRDANGNLINGGALVGGGGGNLISSGSAAGGTVAPSGSYKAGASPEIPVISGKSATAIGIDAQKQDGVVKILAEPTVMAISGQEGSFLAGGKIFIPLIHTAGGTTSYVLEEREFGVSLRFRPTVLADGRINMQVNPEVSELSSTGVTVSSASIGGGSTVLPAFTTRKASTTVQLFDGQSFAIGGLIKNNLTGSISAFPFLGEIPVIGALFRSTSFQTDRSELVFVITPHLVKPLPPDYSLPTDKYVPPTRSEVLFGGKLEGEKPVVGDPNAGGFEKR